MNVLVSLFNSLPGAAGQGLIWGIMAIGVYITYKILAPFMGFSFTLQR